MTLVLRVYIICVAQAPVPVSKAQITPKLSDSTDIKLNT